MTNRFRNQTRGRTVLFRSFVRACVFLSACASAPSVSAQGTLADAVAQARTTEGQDAAIAAVPAIGRLARPFAWIESKIDGASERDGFYPEFGG